MKYIEQVFHNFLYWILILLKPYKAWLSFDKCKTCIQDDIVGNFIIVEATCSFNLSKFYIIYYNHLYLIYFANYFMTGMNAVIFKKNKSMIWYMKTCFVIDLWEKFNIDSLLFLLMTHYGSHLFVVINFCSWRIGEEKKTWIPPVI